MDEKEQLIAFKFEVPTNLVTDDVKRFERVCADMVKLYAKKNHDYGNSFEKGMNNIGMAYGIGRLYDKMNRIITLSKVKAEVNDESIQDTLLDLACYAVMTYNFITGDRTAK